MSRRREFTDLCLLPSSLLISHNSSLSLPQRGSLSSPLTLRVRGAGHPPYRSVGHAANAATDSCLRQFLVVH
jgi:hypothetical protein